MDKRWLALTAVGLGLALGIAADLLFYGKWIGVSFPLFVALGLAALFVFARLARSTSYRRNLWPVIPLCFFAGMVAIRADPVVTALNVGAVLWMAALIVYYRPLADPLDNETLGDQAQAVVAAGVCVPLAPIVPVVSSASWLFERFRLGAGPVRAIGRGLLIACPIVLVFGVLLFSADVIFADYVYRAMHIFSFDALQEAGLHATIAAVLGWICCGGLTFGVLRQLPAPGRYMPPAIAFQPPSVGGFAADDGSDVPVVKPKHTAAKPFRLGMVEAAVVFGTVNLLFGVFVLVQIAYFFGGRDLITVETGWTYAQYARRGFFELLAVSMLTLGLILWLDRVTSRVLPRQQTIFRALACVMIGLTGVMLVSASGRMSLYEEAYGFTHLRLYTHTFMLWLGVLFGAVMLSLFTPGRRVFALGVTLCALGFVATLNLMNVDSTIAARNLARAEQGHDLDTGYVYTLSSDAVPVVLSHYLSADASAVRDNLGRWLSWQLAWLDARREAPSFVSAHLSRDTAWAQLDAARDQLPGPYDSRTLQP